MSQWVVPILGEIMRENFERDGLVKTLGCTEERARAIVDRRKVRQLESGRQVLDVLRLMHAETARQRGAKNGAGRA